MNTQDKLAEALRNARSFVLHFGDEPARVCLAEIDAALKAHDAEAAQAKAQSGECVMVPRIPTEAMMEAAFNTDDCPDGPSSTPDFNAAYVAMLAAAPQPQAAGPVAVIESAEDHHGPYLARAEAELAALKDENAQLRDVLADRDMDREMAAHANRRAERAEAELAALKARIAGSRHAFLGPNMDRITFLSDEIGPNGEYALVKVEE